MVTHLVKWNCLHPFSQLVQSHVQKGEGNTNIIQKISEFENDQVILCGDWNFVLDPDLDYNNYLHVNNPRARKIILDFIEKENFVDAWRVINENCRKYTWGRLNPTIKQARLDYFL